jgi:hypothetical protein
MKNRICTLAISVVALLSVPAAGATIPGDARSGIDAAERHPLVIKQSAKKVKKVAKKKTVAVGTYVPAGHYLAGAQYDPYAYVPGGSSPAVAKAITAQGQRAR